MAAFEWTLALLEMRSNGDIGDDAFHRIEERLDWAEMNVNGGSG